MEQYVQRWRIGLVFECYTVWVKTEKMMNIAERNERIYKLREEGATFRHIGSLYNISKSRANQVYYRIKDRKDNFDNWAPLKKFLANYAQKVLQRAFRDENILNKPEKVARISGRELLRFRGIGLKTIRETARALQKLGYIEDKEAWLDIPRGI